MWTRIVGVASVRNVVGSVIGSTVAPVIAPVTFALAFTAMSLLSPATLAKTGTSRKVQEVNFDEMSLKGTIRNPDGAYLVQKRGLKFLPLHQVKKDMDAKIRESSFYAK